MKPAISVEGISKQYTLGSEAIAGQSFREMVLGSLTAPWRKFKRLSGQDQQQEKFWALKDISFEVQPGEILGVIGRNGAGKSTLLKILSRITAPTEGEIKYRGRLASLLEVGTGFHPELTGRENIYLNGAILGMSRQEVGQKLDQIVEFAGVEKFLDTAVKRFSSGMYVRLAFSVAAHLDPDILLVDEVLAVGDLEFQKKCLGQLQTLSQDSGRTVIFVSHNIDAIQRICTSAMILGKGNVVYYGNTNAVISRYQNDLLGKSKAIGDLSAVGELERWGTGQAKFSNARCYDHRNQESRSLVSGQPGHFEFEIDDSEVQPNERVTVSLSLQDEKGATVLLVSSDMEGTDLSLTRQKTTLRCTIETINLVAGNYTLTVHLGKKGGETFDCIHDFFSINVATGNFFPNGHPGLRDHCKTLVRSHWGTGDKELMDD